MNTEQLIYYLAMQGGSSSKRPAPKKRAPFAPPFDPSDDFGIVHTSLPPEQVIPDHFVDPLFLRHSFTCTTLEGDYEPKGEAAIRANGGITFTTGRWKDMFLPWKEGANSTPASALMTPMLVLYPPDVVEAFLTTQAEDGLDDIVIAPEGWNLDSNGFAFTPESLVAWCRFLHEVWGFRIVYWSGDPWREADDRFMALFNSGMMSFYVHGKEVNSASVPHMDADEYNASLHRMIAATGGKQMIGAHFSADDERGMGYPMSAPAYIRDWSQFDGIVHLCQQLSVFDPRDPERKTLVPAGLQGSSTYYGRRRVNLGANGGGDGSLGPGAKKSRCMAFENLDYAFLYGMCDETTVRRRVWEILCGTRDHPDCLPVSGGGPTSYPDGSPL